MTLAWRKWGHGSYHANSLKGPYAGHVVRRHSRKWRWWIERITSRGSEHIAEGRAETATKARLACESRVDEILNPRPVEATR